MAPSCSEKPAGTPGSTTEPVGGAPSTPAGNPDGSCTSLTLPPETKPADVSNPTSVVGTGTGASCTFGQLAAAVKKGGVIIFNCGDAPVTIPVSATLTPPVSNAYANDAAVNTVIDGGNKVTLDGGGAVRILSFVHAGSWQVNNDTLTLQHITISNGKATGTVLIPACTQTPNTNCSTGYDDGQGGAVNMQDGRLRIIDAIFSNNQAALLGPDTGGGAIYIQGVASPAYIVGSTFKNNKASNAGAVGMLWAGAFIFNSLFDGNSAVGQGANNNDPTQCACINNGQNQTGSGGNGGAIYKDGGDGLDVTVCGTQIRNNAANEFGAGIFLTADGSAAKLIIYDSLFTGNTSPVPYWQWCPGVSTDNPHEATATSSSPEPIDSTFCTTSGSCGGSCSS
ncbi:MAG TPA: hypothetical protein VMT17_02220 [Anaeromyxobacteraceae bacterium]|nr:hypothetical protein [Anaeromyxobacteraceae bacterium]